MSFNHPIINSNTIIYWYINNRLTKFKLARLATVDPQNNPSYILQVMYHFTGYNTFVSIEGKPIKNKKFKPIEKNKKYTKKS